MSMDMWYIYISRIISRQSRITHPSDTILLSYLISLVIINLSVSASLCKVGSNTINLVLILVLVLIKQLPNNPHDLSLQIHFYQQQIFHFY